MYVMSKATQTPASVLLSLMDEYQLNPFSLSKEIGLNYQTARQLVTGKSKVTISTALRLAKFFGQTPAFWLDLQREVDFSEAGKDKKLQAILKDISKAKKPALKAKASEKPGKSLSDKRKKAAKVPGAKRAAGRRTKSGVKK
jgi:addiction module HigA family antidote